MREAVRDLLKFIQSILLPTVIVLAACADLLTNWDGVGTIMIISTVNVCLGALLQLGAEE